MSIKLEGFDELYDLLREMPDLALRAGETAMQQTLMTLHGKLPEYPNPPGTDAPSPLVTLRQRR